MGWNSDTIEDSFWDVNTSGLDNMCAGGSGTGCDDSMGKTTAEMMTMSTFTDYDWDFVGETINGPNDFWDICEGVTYPRLGLLGDFSEPNGVDFGVFAVFADHWQETDCNGTSIFCDHTDIDRLGSVDFNDLYIFIQNWLIGLE